MADVSTEETKIVESLARACHDQFCISLVLTTVWLFRFVSCSQLKYLTEEDVVIAQWVAFNALLMCLVVNLTKIANTKVNKPALAKLLLCSIIACTLILTTCIWLQAVEVVQHLTNLILCESLAFGSTERVVAGLHGNSSSEIGKSSFECPWVMSVRKSVPGAYFCPFDNESLALISQEHWKRDLGLANYRITLFVVAYCAVVVLMSCVPLIRLLFVVCVRKPKDAMASGESIESPPAAVTDHDPPPLYTSREQSHDHGSSSVTDDQSIKMPSADAIAAAIDPPTCVKCNGPISEELMQKVFTKEGKVTGYHKACVLCVRCGNVIEDQYVWHDDGLYHKHCSWEKLMSETD